MRKLMLIASLPVLLLAYIACEEKSPREAATRPPAHKQHLGTQRKPSAANPKELRPREFRVLAGGPYGNVGIHNAPDARSPIITAFDRETTVTVRSVATERSRAWDILWYEVELGGESGWVSEFCTDHAPAIEGERPNFRKVYEPDRGPFQ